MKSNYKKIGELIRLVDERNVGLKVTILLWLSISKQFIPSVANIIGTDMENYKIIRKDQFACSLMQVRRDKKIPVALLRNCEEAIISQAYPVFEVMNRDTLLPEYLMMWFSREEFDRESCFYAVGWVRWSLEWSDFCDMELPIPSIEKQKEIIAEYDVLINRINLNNTLIEKLADTAQALYKQWFVDKIDLENLPDRWKIEALWKIIEISSGKSIEDKNDFIDKTYTYPIYWAWNIMGYSSKVLFDEKILSMWRVGTHWVIQRINFPCWTTDNTLVIKTSYYEYTYQILKNLNYDEINRWWVQWLITQTDVKNSKIILPDNLLLNNFEETVWKIMYYFDQNILQNQSLWKMKDLILAKMASVE